MPSTSLPPNTINDSWKHAADLTVEQAAALLAGLDPSIVEAASMKSHGVLNISDFPGLPQSKSVLVNAINARKLPAKIRHQAREYGFADREYDSQLEETPYDTAFGMLSTGKDELLHPSNKFFFNKLPDWSLTTVSRADLITWLRENNRTDNFFFAEKPPTIDYLDPAHKRYAAKLAASVQAWQAVTEADSGSSVKHSLMKWLNGNAKRLKRPGDGELSAKAIKECAQVANWKPGGGAPETPHNP